jgi:hypothetical protein
MLLNLKNDIFANFPKIIQILISEKQLSGHIFF